MFLTSSIPSIAVSVIAFSKTGMVFTSTWKKIMITVKRGVREDLGNWFSGRWILIRWWMMQVQVAVGACRENMTVGDWRRWCVRRRWCVYG